MPPCKADWRGWLALAWVLAVLVLYGKMVVEQRGGRVRELVGSGPTRPHSALSR
jgi:hypothetical protein